MTWRAGKTSPPANRAGNGNAHVVESLMYAEPTSRVRKAVSQCVSNGYTFGMTKDAGLRIRVEHSLREQFVETCRLQDKPAAQVLREFMREYVAVQGGLRPPAKKRPSGKGRDRIRDSGSSRAPEL